MLKTTLNKIRECDPCSGRWETLLRFLGKTQADDEELLFLTIVESNGYDDALWCMRAAPEYEKEWRLFAVWCARQVQHLMTDERSIAALDVAEKHTNVDATDDELNSASNAAWAAVSAEKSPEVRASASAAAWAAAWAAASNAASAAATAEARYAARAAASNAASNAASAAASAEASAAAWATESAEESAAAWAAARYAQKQQFIKIISGFN